MIVGSWAWFNYRSYLPASLPEDAHEKSACELWFVGSSSIHRWTSLKADMQPWVAVNRGIDGAVYPQIVEAFQRDTRPPPRAIILYAGENDIAQGASVRSTVRQLAQFLAIRSAKMGDVPVLLLSMKPSPGRWRNVGDQQLFNRAARLLIAGHGDVSMVDIFTPLLREGRPGPYYVADRVHMNADGYRIWAGVIKTALHRNLPPGIRAGCEAEVKGSRTGRDS